MASREPRKPGERSARQRHRAGSGASGGDAAGEKEQAFTPDVLESSVIALPLLDLLEKSDGPSRLYDVIIDLNLTHPGGRKVARARVEALIGELLRGKKRSRGQGIYWSKTELSEQYVFARLRGNVIQELVGRDRTEAVSDEGQPSRGSRTIYKVWPDFEVGRLTRKSISTVKADAARNAFGALGKDIVWAVLDSGIDADHPHFRRYRNLELEPALLHRDFTTMEEPEFEPPADGPVAGGGPEDRRAASAEAARRDEHGHGTHVAGIIAGALSGAERDTEGQEQRYRIKAQVNHRDESGKTRTVEEEYLEISGMAPACKLLSLKVLDDRGKGSASNLLAAIEYIQRLNGNGRRLLVHGVNMSVGYDFEPKWFACGQSPLCVEVDRLVRSGVVVVVAAGNTGYGWNQSAFRGAVAAGMDLTINDPGNAELAITVGSTHRDMPHVYGVSYFSSKGPTGDGRMKPDLVAPGEKIVSAASSLLAGNPPADPRPAAELADPGVAPAALVREPAEPSSEATPAQLKEAHYREDSGTSMAAPHVSGVIAAFLSVRREFIGRPERVKEIFLETATDLRRTPTFQGRGLVDLMRAIQSV